MAVDLEKEETPTPNRREQWLQNMRAKYPDVEDEDELFGKSMEGYDQEHNFAKRQRDENSRLAETIQSSPELANFYAELFERGKNGTPELALLNLLPLFDGYKSGELTSEAFEKEVNKRKQEKTKQDKLMEAQNAIFQEWCQKRGYDPEVWMAKANDALLKPMAEFSMAENQFDAIDKMLNYDDDVTQAEVRGRNANISAQRKQVTSDGVTAPASEPTKATARGTKPSAIDSVAARRLAARNL